ncbi:MAG: hypothetical protein LQ342_001553 [Letrouitia transgressa]|nr:MAG: hypothetical protein LQ342_001553 [Letrouitia transgressa]
MDDSDFEQEHTSKKRRVNGSYDCQSSYSSADDLAASPGHDDTFHQRRNSNSRRESPSLHQRDSYNPAEQENSADELDRTPRPFYRSTSWKQSLLQSAPRYRLETPDAPTEISIITPRGPTRSPSPLASHHREAIYIPYKLKMVLKGHRRGVAAVKFSPDGRLIASCSADATIRIWDVSTGIPLHSLEGHLAGISSIAWSPDGKTLASGSDDKSIRLWNVSTGKAYPVPLLGHHNYIYSLAFSPKGNMLVSGSYDEAVFLWDVRAARVMRSLPAHSDPVGGVDFCRDGTLIASCASDGLIRIWDTPTGQCLRTLVHEDNAPVTSVRFSPNGKFVLAWTLDSCVRLWDYERGRCVKKTYQGHVNTRFSLSGSFGIYGVTNQEPGERKAFIVSGSEDGEMLWWDVQSKEILQKEEAHEGCVLGVDTWEKGGLVVSCGLDKLVKIWERVDQEPEGVAGEVNGVR